MYHQWNIDTIFEIMFTCYILHNIILKDECYMIELKNIITRPIDKNVLLHRSLSFEEFMIYIFEIENENIYYTLEVNFIEDLWALKDINTYV